MALGGRYFARYMQVFRKVHFFRSVAELKPIAPILQQRVRQRVYKPGTQPYINPDSAKGRLNGFAGSQH
jgi:hypothetical protein